MSEEELSTKAEQAEIPEEDAFKPFGDWMRRRPILSVWLLLIALCLFDLLQRVSLGFLSRILSYCFFWGMLALFVAALAIPVSRFYSSFLKIRPVALRCSGILFVPAL